MRERESVVGSSEERPPQCHTTCEPSSTSGQVAVSRVISARDQTRSRPATQPQTVFALQRLAGNHATEQWIKHGWQPVIARQQAVLSPAAEADQHIGQGDWSRAARSLAQLVQSDPESIKARVSRLSSAQRQYLVEGARHIEASDLITMTDGIDHRAAIIGSVRFYVWKHIWSKAGEYLCGLNDSDIRRVATQLRLNWDDLRAIADDQTVQAQKGRLNVAFFSKQEFISTIPKDLVGKDADQLVRIWLAADEIVAPYAAAKWSKGSGPRVHIVPTDKWADLYAERSRGKIDPELGRERTADEAHVRAVRVDGFTSVETGDIYLRQGDDNPGKLIHEAIHALASGNFADHLGTSVNEGTTEYFGRRVARSAGKHPPRAYIDEHTGVEALVSVVGVTILAEAFFTGKTLRLESAVDDKKGVGKFNEWRRAMNENDQRKNAPTILLTPSTSAAIPPMDAGPAQ